MTIFKNLVFLLTATLISLQVNAQNFSTSNSGSKVTIYGTSNLHDWDMKATNQFSGSASISEDAGKIKSINSLTFKVAVTSLKSGKKGMDKNAYKALKSSSYKTIDFSLSRVSKLSDLGNNSYRVTGVGSLKIAGVSKQVTINFRAKKSSNKIVFGGKLKIDMTDYKVKPPRALLGTIKTGKDITIDFNVTYN